LVLKGKGKNKLGGKMEQEKEANRGTESFDKILSDKVYNKKWLNFARKELRGHRNTGSARHKEAEDYVEDVKLKILTGEIVPVEGNGDIDNFICGIIRNEIKVEFRKEPVMVTLRDQEDQDDEEDGGEESKGRNSYERTGSEIDENLIVSFEDPFEERLDEIGAWELMKVCYELLEKEEEKLLIVFDERAKGNQNRKIAQYLNIEVKEVENIWRRIVRLLRKEISIHFS
jgi:DNA-directed RNA polymerase specialized sigma24 family protein